MGQTAGRSFVGQLSAATLARGRPSSGRRQSPAGRGEGRSPKQSKEDHREHFDFFILYYPSVQTQIISVPFDRAAMRSHAGRARTGRRSSRRCPSRPNRQSRSSESARQMASPSPTPSSHSLPSLGHACAPARRAHAVQSSP